MRLKTLAAYLVGDRNAILRIAQDRSALAVGALFVLSAAFAREYDAVDLRREPWRLALPFAASLVMSALLFLAVRFGLTPKLLRESDYPHSYRAFLGCFWMTAPLAWLYAVPYERFLSESDAAAANLITLGFVALWRVLLISKVSAFFSSRRFVSALFWVLLLADAAFILALIYSPAPPIDVMSGMRLTQRERILEIARLDSAFVCVGSFPIWLIGAVVVLRSTSHVRPPALIAKNSVAPRGSSALYVAIASVLVWAVLLPGPQREQRLASTVDEMLRGGRVSDGLGLMSSHARSDFPPVWEPAPRVSYYERTPRLLDVIALIEKRNLPSWVRALYIDKLERAYLRDPPWVESPQRMKDWPKVIATLSRLSEGKALSAKYQDQIQDMDAWTAAQGIATQPTTAP